MLIDIPSGQLEIIKDLESSLHSFLKTRRYTAAFMLTHPHLFALYGQPITALFQQAKIPLHQMLIEPGEQSKTLKNAEHCWQSMHRHGLDRSSLMIGLGGGVVTDLAGFVASCYMRGIDCLYLPTTLLAMVDAAIGGKTAVNLPTGKNAIGSYCHPKHVLIKLDFLHSLPLREMQSGMAEVIKYGVIRDPALFEFLESHMPEIYGRNEEALSYIISTSCNIKSEIVLADERDNHMRAILNYGHTFAHAIETATAFQTYLHGEAVAIGMCCAARAGQLLGMADEAFVNRQKNLCRSAGLPTRLPRSLDNAAFIEWMRHDKKACAGEITLIIPQDLGKVCRIPNVDPALIDSVLNAAKEE